MKKNRIIFALVLLITFAGICITIGINEYRSFTHEKWFEEPEKRHTIVGSLIKKYDFANMTREQIISLLGEPESIRNAVGLAIRTDGKGGIVDLNNTNSMFYIIKTGRVPEEFKGFYLKFDNSGKVVDYAIIRFTT